jgi:hypothetical protein
MTLSQDQEQFAEHLEPHIDLLEKVMDDWDDLDDLEVVIKIILVQVMHVLWRIRAEFRPPVLEYIEGQLSQCADYADQISAVSKRMTM